MNINPIGKYDFNEIEGKKVLIFSNFFRILHFDSFPLISLEQLYNYSTDSLLISQLDSTRISNCNTVQFKEIFESDRYENDFNGALFYRSKNDVLLITHPLFNKEQDTATIASLLFTENYIIKSFTDFAINGHEIKPIYRIRFLDKIKTETKYYENSRKDEIFSFIYRGKWYE